MQTQTVEQIQDSLYALIDAQFCAATSAQTPRGADSQSPQSRRSCASWTGSQAMESNCARSIT